MILTLLLKLPKNGKDWGKLIVAKGFKKLPKIQNIAQSGHTTPNERLTICNFIYLAPPIRIKALYQVLIH